MRSPKKKQITCVPYFPVNSSACLGLAALFNARPTKRSADLLQTLGDTLPQERTITGSSSYGGYGGNSGGDGQIMPRGTTVS
ncbi:hypothetical protein K2173_028421 [Erythroxylum novogranatense]|uniref:Uncharacterized protein n=1 Tax=Erythroxylum novogranatense TaxID=1862640 RepID=A0AAV8U4U6_9ROSI|nr:hypothetical protein K2173_028421 [Erythroxylum novogranatense]